ncbi:PHP domain-containing protein [Staphylococcus equorum]|uniref:DNA-directed DNA polymerase n=1 Tax=Staphylococcus equorum TaxID=246432 RepID=A0A9X4LBF4_9STAP|nr:PHP domain-containing protein [Staphylococcus equorum]MDG0860362.1 PHP domain-containing protein [Staphylococcus equorum]
MDKLQPFLTHSHTVFSNFRLRDAINKPEDLLDYALEIGLKGITITDHEILSGHFKAYQHIENNKEKFKDFQLSFGNEVYLVDKNDVEYARENNEKIPFYHFILIAKNQRGYRALKELSSKAWANSFWFRGMERVPTYKDELTALMEKYRGDIIATSACVGGELPQTLIKYHKDPNEDNKKDIHNLIVWLKGVFENDLYFELQPSKNEDQLIANEMLEKVGAAYGVKRIVATDAHYLNKSKANAHKIYLQASQGEREVDEFYATTYVMNTEELEEFFDSNYLQKLIRGTHDIMNKIESISFEQDIKIPRAHIPDFTPTVKFEDYYDQYEYIKAYSESDYRVDRFYLNLIAEGMNKYNEELNEENLSRINLELGELYHITKKLNQPLSSYFVLTKELVDIMWKVSLVGVSRGSASCYYLNYLLGIVQINPIKYDLPHWRFLSKERAELPDIDLDSEGSKRAEIMALTKEVYGEENVLNMGTFTTEKTRSTVLTTCRGLGIDTDVSHNIANLIPSEKAGIWSLRDCFYGNKETKRKPVAPFINEVNQYEGLQEAMLAIEGVVSGRGQHASGVIIYPDGYLAQNAMMRTTSGLAVTQFDAKDSEKMGGLKLDYLSITSLDRIRSSLEMLVKYNKIEWKGDLRKTYEAYFHPDVLEMKEPEMFKMLYDGHVLDAFQFETNVGQHAINKLNAQTFDELVSANSLMRLSGDGEQPLDKFIKHKNNIDLWFNEMRNNGLNDEEIETMKKHLMVTYGITDSQEGLMELIMDPKISGYSLTHANKFRKAIAKQDQDEINEHKELFYKSGEERGTSTKLLDYVWKFQFTPSFGYAFSKPHTAGYTLILMIEMNICYRYSPVFWKTACLTVNSGLIGDESTGGANYGAISKAIGDMKGDVLSPDINISELGFTPLEDEQKVLFGLKPISGLGLDVIEKIIERRPYKDFEDFYNKMVIPGDISEKKVVTLIKSGSFNNLNPDVRLLMIDFVKKVVPKRDKITMVQFPSVIHMIDQDEYKRELKVYDFRNKCFGRNKVPINKEIESEFISDYSKEGIDYTFENGSLIIDQKSFDKFYQKSISRLKDWITKEDVVNEFNKTKMREFWVKHCMGSKESWEMETTLFYSNYHELDYIPLNKYFSIANYKDLPKNPEIQGWKSYRGRQIPQFKIDVISGTVVEKNKSKSLVYVLTQNGVVTVRYSKGQFSHYDKKVVQVNGKKKEVLDESWFTRGTKLVLVGFRRGDEFVLRKTGTIYNNTTMKISSFNQNDVNFQMEKIKG